MFGSLVAFTAYVWVLAHAPVSLVATYAYVNPVVAVALGALVLDEQVTRAMVLGGLVVVAAVAVVITAERRPRTTLPPADPAAAGAAPSPGGPDTAAAPGPTGSSS